MVDQKREAQLRDAIEHFYFAYRAFTAQPDRILDQRGMGRMHHRILYFVGRNTGLSVNELLNILGISKQALNAPLRQLIEMKLIATEAASHDKRVKKLTLTESGRKLETQLTQTQMKHLSGVFDKVGSKSEHAWLLAMKTMPMPQQK